MIPLKDKIIVGLDIGTTKICATVGKRNEFGKLEILGMGQAVSEGVVRGMVSNIDKTIFAIQQAIQQASDNSNIDIKKVNVGIAGQHIKSTQEFYSKPRFIQDQEISKDEVEKLTKEMYNKSTEPGTKILHVLPQSYIVDNEEGIIDPVGMPGSRFGGVFHVITAKESDIQNITKCVTRAGLVVEDLILEPLASSLAVLHQDEIEAGIALIDIGGGTTDLAIFKENTIQHTAVLPFGGNIITQDIKQGCSLLQKQAEALKIQFGKAIAAEARENEVVSIQGLRDRPPIEISIKNLANIIQARIDEILELVFAEMVRKGFDNLQGGIVITGGGSMLQHLPQRVEFITGLPCRIGYPNEHLGRTSFDLIKSPIYSTSIGLVLAGFMTLDMKEKELEIVKEKMHENNDSGTKAINKGFGFIKNIIEKSKSMLSDDFDEKSDY